MLSTLLCRDQESRKSKKSLAKDTDAHTGVSIAVKRAIPKLSSFKQPTLIVYDLGFGNGEGSARMVPLCSRGVG